MSKSNTPVIVLLVVVVLLLGYIWVHGSHPAGDSRRGDNADQDWDQQQVPSTLSNIQSRERSMYGGRLLYGKESQQSLNSLMTSPAVVNSTRSGKLICERWAVVTTINGPTPAVQRQAHLRGAENGIADGRWCLLVVADTGSPEHYLLETPHNNFVYLSEQEQRAWTVTGNKRVAAQEEFLRDLPWGHVGRKNVGYLYAVLHGARYIWDFDDDVMVLSKHLTIPAPGEADLGARLPMVSSPTASSVVPGTHSAVFEARVPAAPYASEVLNPYPFFEANHFPAWPRGFPPDRVLSNSSSHDAPIALRTVQLPAASIGVVQFLANHDPDVDSLYRMIRPLPLDFPLHGVPPLVMPASAGPGGATVAATAADVSAIPSGAHTVFAPYNAQSTLHARSALWALLLPLTPHPRVSDIWRSYIAQRLFADIGVRIAFHSPIVAHVRRAKEENLPDMLSELPLYRDSLDLARTLRGWQGRAATLPGRMEELYVALYEQGFLGLEDVRLVQRWLAALLEVGYDFPPLSK